MSGGRRRGVPRPWQRLQPAVPAPRHEAAFRHHHPHGHIWRNDRYTVIAEPAGQAWVHLSIRRNDRAAIHDWRDLQRIKTDVCGPEAEGVELYPAESRLIDTANQYHLWVLVSGERLPLGFHDGRVMTSAAHAAAHGARQRDPDPALPLVGQRQAAAPTAAASASASADTATQGGQPTMSDTLRRDHPAASAVANHVRAALAAVGGGWQLTQARDGTLVVVTEDDIRHLVRVEKRPLAVFDPASGTITCPWCGSTSRDGTIEHWEDEVARRRLDDTSGDAAVFASASIGRFNDDGTDPRLGCTNCGGAADVPDGLRYDWTQP